MKKYVWIVVLAFCGLGTPIAAQSPAEGIRIRGHWTLEVRNPDGSLADRREFDNHLGSGASVLPRILARQKTPGIWQVYFGTSEMTQVTSAGDATSPFLVLGDSLRTATVTTPQGDTLMLKATATATASGTIKTVHTFLSDCPATVAPSECAATNYPYSSFTTTAITVNGQPTPLPLVKDQILQVTVTITFSSGSLPPSF